MPNVAEIIRQHVTLDMKCVDRLYLNSYVPRLQSEGGVVALLRQAEGRVVPSPAIFWRDHCSPAASSSRREGR